MIASNGNPLEDLVSLWSTSRPRLLDLFCGAGGAAMGYYRAGFDVVGVDIAPQPEYPFPFLQMDALAYLTEIIQGRDDFDAIHASPPCQAHTNAQKIRGNEHPDLIAPTRALLKRAGRPWIIENVPGAPLRKPIELCGCMFPALRTYRPRLFESAAPLSAPAHAVHAARTTKMGRPPQEGEFMHVVGNFSGVAAARVAMGIDWMSRNRLREAIPPLYTEHVGGQLLAAVREVAA